MNGQWVIERTERQLDSQEILELISADGALDAAERSFDEPYDPDAVLDLDELADRYNLR